MVPRTGLDSVERRNGLPLPGLELRPNDGTPRSQSLYRLHYPDSLFKLLNEYNFLSSLRTGKENVKLSL
jgi:hypothetical protein